MTVYMIVGDITKALSNCLKSGLALLLLGGGSALAAPGDIIFQEQFNDTADLSADWSFVSGMWINSVDGDPSPSLAIEGRTASRSVTSIAGRINANVPGATLSFWVRKGFDTSSSNCPEPQSCSEYPENGENFQVEYLNDNGSWVALTTYSGGGTSGEVFNYNQSLPADALHSGLQLRFTHLGGNTDQAGWDFWHVDSVVVTETDPAAPATIPAPRADWRMDETEWNGTAGEVTDSSGNNYSGTAFSTTTTTGFLCNAGDFSANGTSDYLSMDRDAFNGLTNFTISTWVQTTNTSSQGIISGSSGSQHNELIMWWHNQNQFRPFLKGSSSGGNISASINNGAWRHLVWTRNGSQNCLYVDSVLQSCVTRSASALNIATGGLIIGQEQDSLGGGFVSSQDWEGSIDEILVFDSAFSSEQVTLLFNRQSAGQNWDGSTRNCSSALTLVAEWRFDESVWSGTAGEVADASGNTFHGTAFNGANTSTVNAAVPGDPGTCGYGSFDGSNDYVQIPHNAALNGTDALTYTAWINPDSWGGIRQVMAKSVHGGGSGRAQMGIFSESGQLKARAETVGGRRDITASLPATGSWTHVAAVFAGNTLSLYIDGVEAASSSFSDTTLRTNSDPLNISKRVGTNQYFFDGLIDEVRVYSNALSQSQVQTVMAETRPCPVSGPDHYSITAANGVACESIAITVSAHDSIHGLVDAQGATVTLTTSTGLGTWSGTGVTDATPGDGVATLNFSSLAAGATQTTDLQLSYPSINTADGNADSDSFTISVSDGSISNTSGGAIAADNPTGTVSLSGFRFGTGTDATFSTVMPNQTAGVSNNVLRLQAIRTDTDTNECVALYPNQTRTVGLAASYRNPTAGAGISPSINSTGIASYNDGAAISSYTNISLAFDSESIAILNFNYDDVGQLMLHALDSTAAGTATARGSSGNFVVRPHHFDVSVSGNPGTTSSGSGFIAAATPFNATVLARNASGALTPNYGNETVPESVSLAFNSLVFPVGGSTGSFTNTTFTGANGSFSGANLSWSEVGTITLIADVADGDYLGTGAGAATPTPSGNIGRFYPADFALTSSSTQNGCNAGGFSYLSQPNITVAYTLTARNASGATTTNYESDSDGNSGTANYPVATVDHFANQGVTDLSSRLTIAGTDWVNGVYGINTSSAVINRTSAGTTDGPYTSVQLSAGISGELDSVAISGSANIGNTLNLRFGRAFLSSVHGPESTPLSVPFGTEYWNGSQFVAATDDSCTAVALTDIRFNGNSIDTPANRTIAIGSGSTTGTLFTTGANATTTAGTFGLMFSAPGAGNTGSFPVTVDLTNYAWLRSDWNQDGNHNNDASLPAATVSFEHYRGHDRVIYWRERFD